MALQSGSSLTNASSNNFTGTALSTHIIIKVNGQAVGAVQTLEITEERRVTAVDEVGTDGHIDSAPTSSTNITGTCSRIRYDRLRIAEAFGRGFLHAKSQRIPFDIEIYDQWNGDSPRVVVTKIKNVWITNISYSYAAENWIITDRMNWMAEDISSSINGDGKTLAAQGGTRNLTRFADTEGIEAAADIGVLRGAVDSNNGNGGANNGIINAVEAAIGT